MGASKSDSDQSLEQPFVEGIKATIGPNKEICYKVTSNLKDELFKNINPSVRPLENHESYELK